MSILQSIILGFIQGFTEFLPISSSGHLIIPKDIFGWPDQGLSFDVAVHVGSLLAVILYFFKDIQLMIVAWLKQVFKQEHDSFQARVAWMVILGTIPAALLGFVFEDIIEQQLRSILVISFTTIVFGLLLWWADVKATQSKSLENLSINNTLFIGFMQAVALIPGTSRSGITMTAALMAGYTKTAAARFSFLLSIPLILAIGLYKTKQLIESEVAVNLNDLLIGTSVSFVTAFTCIYFFLKWIEKMGFLPFVIYRLVLGVALAIIWWQTN